MASADLRDELDCSICLITYTDPVTLRCGHNFCRVCIDRVLDTQDQSGLYSCPECREEFTKRPVLKKNQNLCNIVERFSSTESTTKDFGIFCTYCVDSPVPAVKSCLHCEASLCDKHLRTHNKSPEHVLSEPRTSLENRKCSVHKKVLEYYCTEDAACICVSCSLTGQHKGHQLELLKEASIKKKEQLRKVSDNLSSKREENVSRIQALHNHMTNVHDKAQVLSQSIPSLLTDIRRQVDDLEKRVLSEICRQEEQTSLSVSKLVRQLEIEKDHLSRTISSIQQMCATKDPLLVLKDQELQRSDIHETDPCTGDDVHAVGDLDIFLMSMMIHETMERIVQEIDFRGFNKPEVPNILLDIDTSGNDVAVSEDLKTASWPGVSQNRLDTPETFQSCQVLSKTCFSSGKYFFEVNSNDGGDWCVGMSYSSIDRKGEQCIIGQNNKSWALRLWSHQYSVIHDSKVIQLPAQPYCKKLGLYLDYGAGQLSFYELCDPMRHLHTFTTTFTEPLHVLCWVLGSSLQFGTESDVN
ncbi:E3 ubiquitin-protein ligase Midline-1-like [Hyla sarda]|uniref:E3 ubiquitin-protein ligase Midline-1-like n=1 Tax=Hyla sarda TaxID=327740 RepID=UPI0024C25F42|nr:E3 ubiquitin-protein ligase Midline-1-like [Hyla sarda]